MKQQIKKMKLELKELAKQIKTEKPEYRSTVSLYDKSQVECMGWNKKPYIGKDPKLADKIWKLSSSIDKARQEFRHKHIAYCLARGRTLAQIESSGQRCSTEKHSFNCKCPNMNYVEEIMKGMEDEALRSSEVGPLEVAASSSVGSCASGVDAPISESKPVEQRDAGVPESVKPGILDRIKGFLG
jgi:hypothetical protein